MELKVLLIIDNCSGHPKDLTFTNEKDEVVFLPKNTMSVLQPFDQSSVSAFKAKYLSRTCMLWQALDDGSQENGATCVKPLSK